MSESLEYGAIRTHVSGEAASRWAGKVRVSIDSEKNVCCVKCEADVLVDVCAWLFSEKEYSFAGLIVEEDPEEWCLRYVFYGDRESGQVHVQYRQPKTEKCVPSISQKVHAADWHEREVEDLFGLVFEGHPRLGDFVLHEEWPDQVNPMRKSFDATKSYTHREVDPEWRPATIVQAPGAFTMPIGPVYSEFAESAHFLLETVGEDVIRTIPRFFYKYRGVEKIAEGKSITEALLLAERFSGTSAFAHSLAFCHAAEQICGVEVPRRGKVLRILLAELERLRHHVSAIGSICASTAMVVAASQANILEEVLLRLSCTLTGHRYLFGLNTPGGLTMDFGDETILLKVSGPVSDVAKELKRLKLMLRFSSSFLDRLEEVGIVLPAQAAAYGLVGPIARASGIPKDLRKALPYSDYERAEFTIPTETEGDGYARLRILFDEAEQSANIIQQIAMSLPSGPVVCASFKIATGASLGWVEAPRGAAFHWLRCERDGGVMRYRLMTPSFNNWHGFHLAAEGFAFQDFPIIMATFGLSNAESDR